MLSFWLYHSPSLAQRLQELRGYKWGTALVMSSIVNFSVPPSRVTNHKLFGWIKGAPHFWASPWELWPRCTRWWLKDEFMIYIYILIHIDSLMPDWMEISKQERFQCVNGLKLSVALAHSSHVKCETVKLINHELQTDPKSNHTGTNTTPGHGKQAPPTTWPQQINGTFPSTEQGDSRKWHCHVHVYTSTHKPCTWKGVSSPVAETHSQNNSSHEMAPTVPSLKEKY